MPAITTLKGHVMRAMDFQQKEVFLALSRTTPWEDDNNPPEPNENDTLDPNLLGFKKVEGLFFVVPDPEGTIIYKDSRWAVVPREQALERGARWVYVSTFISYTELPINTSFRQIGLCVGLTRKEEVPAGKNALLPHEVDDYGVVEVLDNTEPFYREGDRREQLMLIIEF